MVRMPKRGMSIIVPPRPEDEHRPPPTPVVEVDPEPDADPVDLDLLGCPYCGREPGAEHVTGCPEFPIEIVKGAARIPEHATQTPDVARWVALRVLAALMPMSTFTWTGKVRASGLSGCCLRSQREQWDAGDRPAVGEWIACSTCRRRMIVADDGFLQTAM